MSHTTKPTYQAWVLLPAVVATARGDFVCCGEVKKDPQGQTLGDIGEHADAYKSVGKQKAAWDRFVKQAMRDQVEGLRGPEWDHVVAGAWVKEWIAMAIFSRSFQFR